MSAAKKAPLILVVEDDYGLTELIREELAQRGWEVLHAPTGGEAMALLGRHRPDLVLLDFSLPDMTALQLLDAVEVPPFIVTTGSGDERIAVEMMKKGAQDYLVKDTHFLGALPGAVDRALHAVDMERKLAEAQARLRAADESLRNAQKLESLGRMAGGVAHDFNNLFQAIQGNLEKALGRTEGEARTALDRALKVLAKATDLAHQMLNVSGKSFRRSETLDLNALVQEILLPLQDLPGVAPVQFTGASRLPAIEGDPDQLAQVVSGLVANAREALGQGGAPIRLETRLLEAPVGDDAAGVWMNPASGPHPLVLLAIEDAGAGMTKEVLDKAFDPFFSTYRPGRGLGLPAALGILKGHGSGLWIRTAPGQGTTIRILFSPVLDEAPEAPRPSAPTAAGGCALLLVDDDEDLQETLGEFLRDTLGYRVFQARDGLEAVAVYRRERDAIGLILMDATMPKMTGPDAFRVIREEDPAARAVLCSGFSEEAGTQVAREFGFVEFLKKPFSLRTLQETILRVMGNPA